MKKTRRNTVPARFCAEGGGRSVRGRDVPGLFGVHRGGRGRRGCSRFLLRRRMDRSARRRHFCGSQAGLLSSDRMAVEKFLLCRRFVLQSCGPCGRAVLTMTTQRANMTPVFMKVPARAGENGSNSRQDSRKARPSHGAPDGAPRPIRAACLLPARSYVSRSGHPAAWSAHCFLTC